MCGQAGSPIAMSIQSSAARFTTTLMRPVLEGHAEEDATWLFLILPKEASALLPRRGRTSIDGTLNGQPFRATLEPDGQLSHWLKVDRALQATAGVAAGDAVTIEFAAVACEPEPCVPADFSAALEASSAAAAGWKAATTLARVDWIHWIDSAKQTKTRATRIANACDMLASGKLRVCCFDPSGFYSKSLCAPDACD